MKIIFLLIALVIISINQFPNLYAYLNAPTGKFFSGQASWFDPWDINLYVSAVKWGQNSGILLENTYNTVKNSPVLMYPFYTILGYLFPKTNPYLLFHLAATIVGFLLLITLFKLSGIFLKSFGERLATVFLVALGGGVGWMFFPSFPSSDLFMTGFTFSSHFQRPHEALGVIFYLLSLILFYRQKTYFSLICLSLLVFFYPFYLLSFALIAGIYSLIIYFKDGDKSYLKSLLLAIFPASLLTLVYNNHLQGSAFGGVLSQGLANQGFLEILSGYGILSVVFIYQLFKRPRGNHLLFLNLWIFVSIILSFLPLGFARFYLRTLFFPAVIIALLVLPKRWIFILALLLIVPVSSFYMAYKRVDEIGKNNHWYYISADEKAAIDFLNEKPNTGIMAGYKLGNYLPASTNHRVYFGHLLQTPDANRKFANLSLFYTGADNNKAREFLDRENINYVIWGPEEKEITQKYGKGKFEYLFLKPVFVRDDITIYSK